MNKTIFIAIMAMLTVTAYAQKRRKSDNMPKTEICRDIDRMAIASYGSPYYLYSSPKSLPVGFQRGKQGFFIELRAHMDRELTTTVEEFTIKLEDGTLFKGKCGVKTAYQKKRKGKWIYEFRYPFNNFDILRNNKIIEFTFAGTTFVNPESDKVFEYFNCMVDLTSD